jgi:hypothetical protein
MTDDRFARRLPELMHELAGNDERYLDGILAHTVRTHQRPVWTFPGRWLPVPAAVGRLPAVRPQIALVLALVALLALLLATAAYVGSQLVTERPQPLSVTNGWIAFSTQSGYRQTRETDWAEGGDIYLVSEGVEPTLIVDREDEMSTNVCPAFSPDGSMLAYGTRSGPDRAVVVLLVSADGATAESTRLEVAGDGPAPCPRWSSDGQRVAYLQRDAAGVPDGTVIVRRLDGEVVVATDADPGVEEFELNSEDVSPLLSPTGEYVVGAGEGGIIVARSDGSEPVSVTELESFYAIAAWSPDGRHFLLTQDVSGGHFTMYAVSLDRPGDLVPLAPSIPVNGARSWPGRGDVSWQPVHP